jgi:hypothetical protein
MVIQIKGKKISLNLSIESSLTPNEKEKLELAANHIVDCINSDEFKDWCLGFNYSYTDCTGSLWWKKCQKVIVNHFNWNDGLSNEQVYNKLMSGSEHLSPNADAEMDITLVIDRRNKRGVLGYTYPNSYKQWIYSWFLSSSSYRDVAGNIFHEYCHKLGFDHAYKFHTTRQYTIPYACGYLVRDFKL